MPIVPIQNTETECRMLFTKIDKLQANIDRLKIQLEESRKHSKCRRDRELANAEKCNEYYKCIKEQNKENKQLRKLLKEIKEEPLAAMKIKQALKDKGD